MPPSSGPGPTPRWRCTSTWGQPGRITDLAGASQVLGELRRLGVQVALDDFGSGNSDLGYLLELPIDLIKLDRTLTATCSRPGRAHEVSVGTIELCLRLGIPMVAEGVERPEQARWLAGPGCHYGQGFLFAEPLPAIEITAIPATGVTAG